jgi:hypothetical protein
MMIEQTATHYDVRTTMASTVQCVHYNVHCARWCLLQQCVRLC